MAHDAKKYDVNWRDVIRPAILKRANYKCEICGARQRALYYTDRGKRIFIEDSFMHNWVITNAIKCKKIFLSISHTDHNVNNNDYSNLRALCQFCHLAHDKELHRATRIARKRTLPRG